MDLLYVAQDEKKTGTKSKITKARFKYKFILDNCLEQQFLSNISTIETDNYLDEILIQITPS